MTKQEIGAILMQLRENAGKSREEVAELLGKSAKTIGHWETGYAQPDANTLFLLCVIYNADINESFGFPPSSKSTVKYSPEAMQLARDYDSLNGHGKRMVRLVTDEEKKRMELEAKARKEREAMEAGAIAEKGSDNVMPFRKSIQSCSAGTGVYLGPEEFEIIYVAENELTLRGDFAVPVSGNSMEPTYHDGDILIIEATEDIPVGKIGLFTMDGEGYVKERGENTLLSLNPQYDPIPMREGIRCNGLVIGILDPQWIK